MTRTKNLIASVAALALVLGLPLTAEARFGRSNSDDKGSKGSSSSSAKSDARPSKSHKAVPASAPSNSAPPSYSAPSPTRSHRATPVYRDGGHPTGYHPTRATVHPAPRYRRYGHYHRSYHYGWGFGYSPFFYGAAPVAPVAQAAPVAEVRAGPTATLGVDVHSHGLDEQGHGLGASLGVGMAIEGERWGVNGQLAAAFYAIDGGLDPESTQIYDLHLTYALISGSHGRLRLEGGINGVVAPGLSVLGPDAGASLALGLIGPLGIEAAAHATVVPHRRYDWNAGVTLTLGHVGLRAGWKELWLHDNGLLGEEIPADLFRGPYFGVGFAF